MNPPPYILCFFDNADIVVILYMGFLSALRGERIMAVGGNFSLERPGSGSG